MAELPKYFYFRITPVTNKGVLTQVMVEDASDTDVVEVVRCNDCIHNNSNDPICPIPWVKRMLYSFCSFGERRADNGEVHH